MEDAPQAPKQSFKEWLRQLSDEERQVLLYWLDRTKDNPNQPWDGARPTLMLLGGKEIPYTASGTDENS